MNLIKDESGQSGGLMLVIGGILLVGFFIVAFGSVMDKIQDVNNDLISDPEMHYSADHQDAAILNLDLWGGLAIYALVIFAIWGIKNALKKEDNLI